MPYTQEILTQKKKEIKEKLNQLQIQINEGNKIFRILNEIEDVVTFDVIDNKKIKKTKKPIDLQTNHPINDDRRNEIFDSVISRADQFLETSTSELK